MQNLEKLIACHDKIRITVYGTYNAGKSSTLNSFIGKDLLQVDDEQCTGKPILIRYLKKDEKPKIYRAELKTVKDYDKFSHYAFIEKGQALAEGDEAVKNFISSQNIIVNNNFDKGQNKIDDFFILKTPIKLLDELDLSEEIKNNVEFLDTPGLTSQYLENESDLLEKLIEQTFIYFFIIDPKIGGSDTNSFKQILTNTMLKTINNRSIINDSITFPYLFICNKCDDEETEFNSEKCNQNINSILAKKEKFDIIKFSAHKRKKILNKMNEYAPENFIDKVEKDFFNVLYFNGKTFYDYLDSYISKDFKNNFIGVLNPEIEPDQIILDKMIEILKKKDYKISEENKIILSKLSGYLSFCNNNFDNLKIADNIMMNELKNKIKTKITMAYDHIKNGYKNQVLTALNFIENFIKIGVIPDSTMNRSREKEIKRAEKILSDIKKLLEANNVPEVMTKFRKEIIEKLENKYGLKEDYSNYEEIIKDKQNFISEKFRKINEKVLPEMFSNIQKGISKIIEDAFKDFCEENNIEIYYENGKMMAKIKPSMMGTTLKISGSFLIAAAGIGIVNSVAGSVVIEEVIRNGFLLFIYSTYFATAPFFGGSFASTAAAQFGALFTPIGNFLILVEGIAVIAAGIGLTIYNFGERKKNYYNQSIKNLKEKFFSFYNGFEKKILGQYNAIKEKSAENAASYLNMQYFPVQLDEDQRQNLLNKFENLKKEINNILSLN